MRKLSSLFSFEKRRDIERLDWLETTRIEPRYFYHGATYAGFPVERIELGKLMPDGRWEFVGAGKTWREAIDAARASNRGRDQSDVTP